MASIKPGALHSHSECSSTFRLRFHGHDSCPDGVQNSGAVTDICSHVDTQVSWSHELGVEASLALLQLAGLCGGTSKSVRLHQRANAALDTNGHQTDA
jgi:hypothetical protein